MRRSVRIRLQAIILCLAGSASEGFSGFSSQRQRAFQLPIHFLYASALPSSLKTTADQNNNKAINNGLLHADSETIEPLSQEWVSMSLPPDIASHIPNHLQDRLLHRNIQSLLPSQIASFSRIFNGHDVVLQAPTGSGKTLAYVIPLLSQQRMQKHQPPQKRVATPVILTVAPTRELVQQIGKEWQKLTSSSVASVFGGVPLERHVALLKHKPSVVCGTPGRLRELVREGYLDYSQLGTLIIDEADTLLDKADSPEVQAILKDIESAVENEEYQLVLVSATINQNVRDFTEELGIPQKAYIHVVKGETGPLLGGATRARGNTAPKVQHWHLSCKSSQRHYITANLISIWNPRLSIVFVPTKSETESVASVLSSRLLLGDVRVLHGDMSQTARSRAIQSIRQAVTPQILVATDVASRGLDLTNVDLVVQFGVPQLAGKDGTYSAELYTHRTGRAGRVGANQEIANSVLLYDPAAGEAKVLPDLVSDIQQSLGIQLVSKPIPSALQVAQAGYARTRDAIVKSLASSQSTSDDLASYFRSRLEQDELLDTSDRDQLLNYLSHAMASLSGLGSSMTPGKPHYSLLTGTDTDRTLRLVHLQQSLSPPDVTKFCKQMKSGKLGRVVICKDGSAVFDLPAERATRLLKAIEAYAPSNEFYLAMPLELPEMMD
jgi:superfamily II DNA/RNA helicase